MFSSSAWSTQLQRSFTTFPSGSVGAALLVLRLIVGASGFIEGALTIVAGHSMLNIAGGSFCAFAGLALTIGFLTPVVSGLLAALGVAVLPGLHYASLRLLDSRMAVFEFIAMAAALAILGPGATSVDARLFGRRVVAIRDGKRPGDP